jgi:replication-associated recombination protein RarA
MIKLVLIVINVYAPQVGLSDDVKRKFWKDLENMVRVVPSGEKLLLEDILTIMLTQLEGDLRGYMEILDMTNRTKREKKSWTSL